MVCGNQLSSFLVIEKTHSPDSKFPNQQWHVHLNYLTFVPAHSGGFSGRVTSRDSCAVNGFQVRSWCLHIWGQALENVVDLVLA